MDAAQRVPAMLAFVQTADRGSFAAAARALGISAAAVSKSVANLESALGVRLLNRTTRSLGLTDEGAAFLERARTALDALDAAVDAVAVHRAAPAGKVRISIGNNFGRNYLMPLLPELRRRYPLLQIAIDFDDRQVDLIAEGYDIGLRGGQLEDSSLISRHICDIETVLVATPGYLAQRGIPRCVDDLAHHDLISTRFLNGATSHWRFHESAGAVIEYTPEQVVLTVSSPEAALDAARMGMGIAQIGVHHGWPWLRDGSLKVLLPEAHHPGQRAMALQYPHRALLALRVRVAIEYLVEALGANEALHLTRERVLAYAAR